MLKVFNDTTNNLSGIYYPTTNVFIIECVNIVGAFSECAFNIQLLECINAMKKKWLDCYKELPTIYLIAMCFDPRYRLENLSKYLTAYYHQCLQINYDVDMSCSRIKTLLYDANC